MKFPLVCLAAHEPGVSAVGTTAVYVKLLLLPRQSRGTSYGVPHPVEEDFLIRYDGKREALFAGKSNS